MRLEGKVALVTGATRGIGKAIASCFAREGAKVVLNGRDAERGAACVSEIRAQGGQAVFALGDVGREGDVKQIFSCARSTFGEVEILVNNAARYESMPFRQTSEGQWDSIFQVNLKGVFFCCRQAIEPMAAMGRGVILNLTSIAAKTGGMMPVAAYAASKAGVLCLTKSLARELAPIGIRVNALAPGTIRTGMTASFANAKIKEIPLARLGDADEVASAAVFLCSGEARYITGEIMDVNGGQYMD